MKHKIKNILQKLFGYQRYLFIFSIFTIRTLKWNKNEKDFLFFISLLPNKGKILDIGANIGIMTTLLAQKKNNAHIHAIEPMPDNFSALNRIVQHYKLNNVTTHCLALGDKPGTAEMILPIVSDVKMQGLAHIKHDSITEYNEGVAVQVPIVTLDEFSEQLNERIVAIKMDVENFEQFVLAGAQQVLKTQRPILYTELWDNPNRYACFDIMQALQYKTMVLMNKQLVPFNPERHHTQNFFFIP